MPKVTYRGNRRPTDSTIFLVLSDGTRVGRGETADFSESDYLLFSEHFDLVLEETSPKKSGARVAPGNPRKAVN